MKGVRGICFDLDDTLCAYWDACKLGLRRAFAAHGPEGFSSEECIVAWAKAFREFAPTLKETGWYEGYLLKGEATRTEQMRRTLHRLGVIDEGRAQSLSDAYLVERDRALALFPDSIEVLDQLRSRFQLGLITNGPADIQRMEIETLQIGRFFDPILIEGELGEGKPKPSVFQWAELSMGLKPEQMLMVGNSYLHDIRPALELGWHGVWIRRPSDVPPSAGEDVKVEERAEHHPEPDAVLNDLRSLLDLV